MGKRWVETMRWEDSWFGNLRPEFKLLYCYLCDRCDNAGVWNVNKPLADKYIGLALTWDRVIPEMDGRIIELAGGKRWFLVKFLEFQYAPGFNPNIPAHQQAKKLLISYGIEPSSIPWLCHSGATAVGGLSPTTGHNTTGQEVVRGEPERGLSKGEAQRRLIEATARHLVICHNAKAVKEWMDALRDHAHCRSADEAAACMEWAVTAARRDNLQITFLRHAINYVMQWPDRKPDQWRKKRSA
jgi:hypothetical protein